jgi:hypothetical protein
MRPGALGGGLPITSILHTAANAMTAQLEELLTGRPSLLYAMRWGGLR